MQDNRKINRHLPNLVIKGLRVDGRTKCATNYRDNLRGLMKQVEDPTPAQILIMCRAAMLAVLCSRDEAKFLAGKRFSEANYRQNINSMRTCLLSLGVTREASNKGRANKKEIVIDSHATAVLDAEK